MLTISFWSKFGLWVGWLTGVLLMDMPRGLPSLTSWISWQSVFAVVSMVLHYLTFLALVLRMGSPVGTEPLNTRAVTLKSLFLAMTILIVFQRFYIWGKAKEIMGFLRSLETYDFFGTKREKTESYSSWFVSSMVIGYFLLRVIGAIMAEIAELKENAHNGNLFYGLGLWVLIPLSTWSRVVINLVTFVSLLLIFTSTVKLVFILQDFCDHLEFSTEMISPDLFQVLNTTAELKQDPLLKLGRSDYFLKKLDDLKGMFEQYDRLFGPLYLSYLISSFIGVLHGTNDILVETKEPIQVTADMLGIIGELHFILMIETGQSVQKLIRRRKDRLKNLVKLSKERNPLNNVIELFLEWDWKMTAMGFFQIDRSLVSGLTTTTMTYVVILLQLNTGESGSTKRHKPTSSPNE